MSFTFTFEGGKKLITKAIGIVGTVATVLTVTAGKRRKILNIRMALTTDGTVANRYATIKIRDSADITKFANNSDAVVASQTGIEKFFNPAFVASATTNNALGNHIVDGGEDIQLSISSGVAGDTYDYLVEYLEIDI